MKKLAVATLAAASLLATTAQAATINQGFDVSVTLNAVCRVKNAPITKPLLDFGTYTAFQTTANSASATFVIECTRNLAPPTFTFADGTSYGVIAGLNYNVTPTSAVTTTGNPASAVLDGIGSADERTIRLTGDMPADQVGDCANGTEISCKSAAVTDTTRTLIITY